MYISTFSLYLLQYFVDGVRADRKNLPSFTIPWIGLAFCALVDHGYTYVGPRFKIRRDADMYMRRENKVNSSKEPTLHEYREGFTVARQSQY